MGGTKTWQLCQKPRPGPDVGGGLQGAKLGCLRGNLIPISLSLGKPALVPKPAQWLWGQLITGVTAVAAAARQLLPPATGRPLPPADYAQASGSPELWRDPTGAPCLPLVPPVLSTGSVVPARGSLGLLVCLSRLWTVADSSAPSDPPAPSGPSSCSQNPSLCSGLASSGKPFLNSHRAVPFRAHSPRCLSASSLCCWNCPFTSVSTGLQASLDTAMSCFYPQNPPAPAPEGTGGLPSQKGPDPSPDWHGFELVVGWGTWRGFLLQLSIHLWAPGANHICQAPGLLSGTLFTAC